MKDQIDATGADTHYAYEGMAHLATVTDPGQRTTGYQYDAVGNLPDKAEPGVTGRTPTSTTLGCTVYSYDPANGSGHRKPNSTALPSVEPPSHLATSAPTRVVTRAVKSLDGPWALASAEGWHRAPNVTNGLRRVSNAGSPLHDTRDVRGVEADPPG